MARMGRDAEDEVQRMTITDYLRELEEMFSPQRAAGRRAVLQYVFSGSQAGVCHAVIEGGTIRVACGPHPAPTATVETDFDLWMRVMAYQEDALLAYQAGKFRVSGDGELLMEADSWFPRPIRE